MEKPEEIVQKSFRSRNGLLSEKKAARYYFKRCGMEGRTTHLKSPPPAPSVPPLQLENVDDATPPAQLRSASQMPVFAKPPPHNVRGKVSLTRLRAVALYEPPPPKHAS